ATERRRPQVRSTVGQRPLRGSTDRVLQAVERVRRLLCQHVGQLPCTIGRRSGPGQAREQRRDSCTDRFLRKTSIEAECRRDPGNQVGSQELRDESDEVRSHDRYLPWTVFHGSSFGWSRRARSLRILLRESLDRGERAAVRSARQLQCPIEDESCWRPQLPSSLVGAPAPTY